MYVVVNNTHKNNMIVVLFCNPYGIDKATINKTLLFSCGPLSILYRCMIEQVFV